jgi:hypothetical protein
MAASTMSFATLRPFPWGGALDALAKSCAAAIIAIALLAPTCCLNGAHSHSGIAEFGKICFSRAAIR